MPYIRVLSFRYNASAKRTTSRAGIRDHANNLLERLEEKREHGRDKLRPIVFVGHSLGGVIVKKVCITRFMAHLYIYYFTK